MVSIVACFLRGSLSESDFNASFFTFQLSYKLYAVYEQSLKKILLRWLII